MKNIFIISFIFSAFLHASLFAPRFLFLESSDIKVKRTKISFRESKSSKISKPITKKSTKTKKNQSKNKSIDMAKIIDPRPIGDLSIEYPYDSRANEEEGSVTLEYLINQKGEVFNIKIVKSSGFVDLDNAAKKSLSHYKYEAFDGDFIKKEITINFNLEENE